jgi:SsrA-binding protein
MSKYRQIADNRRAFYEYEILEKHECGMELFGTEVKSLRMGKVQMKEAFARIDNGEVFVHGLHISPYTHGNIYNVDPVRKRRLLLQKDIIRKLYGTAKQQSLTLVPLRMYFKGDWAKIEIGLARGKKLHDKRESIAQKDIARDTQRALKEKY